MTHPFRHFMAATGCVILAGLAASCGGGGGSGGGSSTPPPPAGGGGNGGGGNGGGSSGPTYTANVFRPSSEFVARCEMPRAGTSDRTGSEDIEKFWLRSWSNETYLWYDEIVDRNPYNFNDKLDYFDVLKTDALTPSGNPKDQFHYTYDTEEYEQLVNSGEEVQYGAQFAIIEGTPPRDVRVAYVEAGTSASNAGLARGTRILTADGVNVTNGNDVDTLNAAFFPSTVGETHTFTVQDLGSSNQRTVTLTAQTVTVDPVQTQTIIDDNGDRVGYIHLTTFGTVLAEEQLIDAMTDFSNAGIDDLVLDLRYNGGGFLAIASQLSYMIAGPDQIQNDIFYELVFNDKNPNTNPVTGQPLTPTPFYDTSLGFSVNDGQPLPDLDFERVFILSTDATCSASEAVINGLLGIDVEVVLVGTTTCGKPYGFYGTDNCGTTYFTIQFRGENADGFGDYADGFSPSGLSGGQGYTVTGCGVQDDYGHLLGDPDEAMLNAALTYRNTGSCPTGASASAQTATPWQQAERAGGSVLLSPQSLYASDYLRDRLARRELRNMELNRPMTKEEIEALK